MSQKWIPVCRVCGKQTGGSYSTGDNQRPTATPSASGKCPSSSDGKHKPTWQKA